MYRVQCNDGFRQAKWSKHTIITDQEKTIKIVCFFFCSFISHLIGGYTNQSVHSFLRLTGKSNIFLCTCNLQAQFKNWLHCVCGVRLLHNLSYITFTCNSQYVHVNWNLKTSFGKFQHLLKILQQLQKVMHVHVNESPTYGCWHESYLDAFHTMVKNQDQHLQTKQNNQMSNMYFI